MTKEQKFAKEMSDLVFDLWIGSTYISYLNLSDTTLSKISVEYANNIIDDPKHSRLIHGRMYDNILADIIANPNAFEKENKNMEFCYSSDVFQYGKHINNYIHEVYEKEKWKQLKTKYKIWIEIERIEYNPDTEDEEYFDDDNPIAVAYRDNIEDALILQNDIVNTFNEIL